MNMPIRRKHCQHVGAYWMLYDSSSNLWSLMNSNVNCMSTDKGNYISSFTQVKMQQKKWNKQIILQTRRNPGLRFHPNKSSVKRLSVSIKQINANRVVLRGWKSADYCLILLNLGKSWRSGIALFLRKKQISFMTVQDFRMLHGSKNLEFQLACKTSTV